MKIDLHRIHKLATDVGDLARLRTNSGRMGEIMRSIGYDLNLKKDSEFMVADAIARAYRGEVAEVEVPGKLGGSDFHYIAEYMHDCEMAFSTDARNKIKGEVADNLAFKMYHFLGPVALAHEFAEDLKTIDEEIDRYLSDKKHHEEENWLELAYKEPSIMDEILETIVRDPQFRKNRIRTDMIAGIQSAATYFPQFGPGFDNVLNFLERAHKMYADYVPAYDREAVESTLKFMVDLYDYLVKVYHDYIKGEDTSYYPF